MNINEQIKQARLEIQLEHESLKLAKQSMQVAEKDLAKAVKNWVGLLVQRDFKQEDSPVLEVS